MNECKTDLHPLIRALAEGSHQERSAADRQILELPLEERGRARRLLLDDFANWAAEEVEEPNCDPTTARCMEYFLELLNGDLSISPTEALVERGEPFSRVMDTLDLSLYLGLEMDMSAMESTWSDCVDTLLGCPQCNGPLADFILLVLVVRLINDFSLRKVRLPVPLERQLRLYLLLSLSAVPGELALTWAMGDAA